MNGLLIKAKFRRRSLLVFLRLKYNQVNKIIFTHAMTAIAVFALSITLPLAHINASPFIYELDNEFLTTGDFDGDGSLDIALVDRETGRVRIGYSLGGGTFRWTEWRSSGATALSAVTVGKLTDAKIDSLAVVCDRDNLVAVVDTRGVTNLADPMVLPNQASGSAVGPNVAIAIDIGGVGNNPLDDVFVPSHFNNNPEFRVTLYRNGGKAFTQLSNTPVSAESAHGNRIALKRGGKEFAAFISLGSGTNEDSLLIGKLDGGKLETVLIIPNVPKGSDYITGFFRGETVRDFVFYKIGEPTIAVCSVSEVDGKFVAGAMKKFDLTRPVSQLVTVDAEKRSRLLVVFGETEPAELMDFDGVNAPLKVQSISGYNDAFLHAAIALPDSMVLFSLHKSITDPKAKPAPKTAIYQTYQLKNGRYELVSNSKGNLPLLDDRDDSTVPLIHKRILANLTEKSESDMKAYTNNIPGTGLEYAMTPIPGGEFVMGSPDAEKFRQASEGPQHRVKISPFWMSRFEITWQQFLVFTYPDTEKSLREMMPTPEDINKETDAVTRPSRPYGDMSSDMGQGRGMPAIAMTQHAANKYCHWLSAKTGHFYRLPTEAEWEYACRAGSTNAYFFGDNPADLEDYVCYTNNSDFKYEKVGKKLPNRWGLHDMLGNVAEWVLDQYDETYYQSCATKAVSIDPWNRATKPYPHAIRGGAYDDGPDGVRCSSRFKSGPEWKMTYPNLPKTVWWLSDCTKVGFRIVRPLKVPPPEEMAKYWISGVEKD